MQVSPIRPIDPIRQEMRRHREALQQPKLMLVVDDHEWAAAGIEPEETVRDYYGLKVALLTFAAWVVLSGVIVGIWVSR